MPARKLSISFRKKHEKIYLHLIEMKKEKENVSEYICQLIEADLNHQSAQNVTLAEIKSIIANNLKSISPSSNNNLDKHVTSVKDHVSSNDEKLIDQLFQ